MNESEIDALYDEIGTLHETCERLQAERDEALAECEALRAQLAEADTAVNEVRNGRLVPLGYMSVRIESFNALERERDEYMKLAHDERVAHTKVALLYDDADSERIKAIAERDECMHWAQHAQVHALAMSKMCDRAVDERNAAKAALLDVAKRAYVEAWVEYSEGRAHADMVEIEEWPKSRIYAELTRPAPRAGEGEIK